MNKTSLVIFCGGLEQGGTLVDTRVADAIRKDDLVTIKSGGKEFTYQVVTKEWVINTDNGITHVELNCSKYYQY